MCILYCYTSRGQQQFVIGNFDDIVGVIQKINSIKEELLVEDALLQSGKQQKASDHGGISVASLEVALSGRQLHDKTTILGFDEHFNVVIDFLTRDECALQIIPIVAMGGIGKTTLAKAVFNSQCIVDHFNRRIWITISQEYTVQDILSGLLHDGEVKTRDGDSDRLVEALHKELFGRRYLIVMDDVWSEKAWNDLRICLPDYNNRSRIVMTTRLANVAGYLNPHNSYPMTFLDQNKSWSLFCQMVFANDNCPYPELESFARKIVRSCNGLPLEIIVIGGLLAKSDMSPKYWESVADNVSSYVNCEHDEHCLKRLSLIYKANPPEAMFPLYELLSRRLSD
ncbi:putative late blight resistance protein homolog R1C-3 [Andrographis paniculata]|uniref:putative late blight resistance protein homolog R1C-3 n=1 Tax=Andrographis paniculata TaxID=175694 RepID=UPI0021E815B1|nr:putative late blight resistance protein homolog R1C-3 [Andrographis paniculata]